MNKTEHRNYFLSYHLQMFAKDGPGGEKTEQATAKKRRDTRRKGQVAKSTDLNHGVSLLTLFVVMKLFGGYITSSLIDFFTIFYTQIEFMTTYNNMNFNIESIHQLILRAMLDMLLIMLPVLGIGVIVVIVSNVAQFGYKVTKEPLKLKFSKMNPINGFKRFFKVQSLVQLLKSCVTIIIIGTMVYLELYDKFIYLFYLYEMSVIEALVMFMDIIIWLGIKISILYLILGFADLVYQRRKFKKDIMMTKQEVKDEYKNTEGDPKVKSKQRQRMRQASMRRMMQDVPNADVVITNPTHFAVAIKYDPGSARAPMVLAKGEDFLAKKIKDKAKEHHIEIVENKALARAIYYNVDIGGEIPPELYQAVAEVLAFVYKVKNKAYSIA